MEKFQIVVSRLCKYMAVVAGTALVLVMLLTVLDVILRYFGHPILGVYDLVALGGAIVIGFSLPYAAERKVHVFMEMIQQAQGKRLKQVLLVVTRLIALLISIIVAWHLVRLGQGFRETGEASLTVQIVYYPIAIGLGVCFLGQALVYFVQIFKGASGGENE